MKLSRQQIAEQLSTWQEAWNNHDLDAVMSLFHDQVRFENWTGAVIEGKKQLRNAWRSWFENHGGFEFTEQETFIDETAQKAVYRWRLTWPAPDGGGPGAEEQRQGVDVLHFENGKIIRKLTYSKTTVTIDGRRVPLKPGRE
jgi:ketosteroid isomerase-like protein